ncbi:hypothetical protein CL617_03415 [archaeon]|nr:hypothetical protein [archaeon]|tara:strand:+ start:1898 stop:2812 length:915 start_codon:yes stop_codon:yes gene_type:complete
MTKPKFSIVIALAPERNAEVLDSLKLVDYLKENYEIIVKKGLNPSENRNNGIKESKGEIIVILDDDAYLDENILKNAESFFKEHKDISIVGGPQLTPKTDNFFAKTSGYVLESKFGAYQMSSRYTKQKLNLNADEKSITSANCFIRKNIIKDVGYFNTNLYPGEDPEFFSRAKNKGFKIAYSPNLIIYHKRRNTFFSFLKQIYKYGKVRLQKENINKSIVNPVFLIPSIFFIYVITLPLTYQLSSLFVLPLILYIIINILFSFIISFKNEPYAFPLIFILFFSIHLSYGLGMLIYILKFKNHSS